MSEFLFDDFALAAGSVTGRDHTLAGRNNQDAYAVLQTQSKTIAVIADGCSEGPQSEVGAALGVRLFSNALSRHFSEAQGEILLELARKDTLAQLHVLANSMGEQYSKTITEYFLFTLVGALLTPAEVLVFWIGDGVYAINGEIVRLGPFSDNQPPYLAYGGLVGSSIAEEHPKLVHFQHVTVPTSSVQSLMLGSDGVWDLLHAEGRMTPGKDEPVGPISQFWEDRRYFRNPDAVRRKLALVNRSSLKADWQHRDLERSVGLLSDDTTLVAMRRKE